MQDGEGPTGGTNVRSRRRRGGTAVVVLQLVRHLQHRLARGRSGRDRDQAGRLQRTMFEPVGTLPRVYPCVRAQCAHVSDAVTERSVRGLSSAGGSQGRAARDQWIDGWGRRADGRMDHSPDGRGMGWEIDEMKGLIRVRPSQNKESRGMAF
ncbi:hypothetical protein BC628DRAFT_263640 [Trametes gibbosa]|nr:hypothetical protein BC628DRAFT_263640 [Trametes gibbosa]